MEIDWGNLITAGFRTSPLGVPTFYYSYNASLPVFGITSCGTPEHFKAIDGITTKGELQLTELTGLHLRFLLFSELIPNHHSILVYVQ